jgi:hypothetical protein
MMKSRKPLLSTLAAGALMFAGTLIAQDVPPPPAPAMPAAPATSPVPAAPMPPAEPMPSSAPPEPAAPMPSSEPMPAPAAGAAGQASYQTPQGEVVVRSVAAPAPTIGPAPAFEQLSGGGKSITADQAVAYPPLANDFIHADSNRNGTVSKTEYTNWTKQP